MRFWIVREIRLVDKFIRDYYIALSWYLREAGHTVEVTTLESVPSDPGIYLFFHSGLPCPDTIPSNQLWVLMNLEQLTRLEYLQHTVHILAKYPKMLYADYSTANLEIIRSHIWRTGLWMPYFFNPEYLKPFGVVSRDINTFFFGGFSYSANRQSKLKPFNAYCREDVFGAERDSLIRRSKVVLNVHYAANYGVFESLRAYHAIYLGTPVYSLDTSLPEQCFLGKDAQRYLLTSPNIPDDLPELTFEYEIESARNMIGEFTELLRSSLSIAEDPSLHVLPVDQILPAGASC
jgi:hypothetical protein